MTVLYSFFSSEGVVFAADRMLTKRLPGGKTAFHSLTESKLFRVPNVSYGKGDALLGYFGCAEVGGQSMARWLRGFFRKWPGGTPAQFAGELVQAVTDEQTQWQRRQVLGFHLAAYERIGGYTVPGFWFIRNGEINAAGRYAMLTGGFHVDEQLRQRDFSAVNPSALRDRLRQIQRVYGMPYWYRNGDLDAFVHVADALKDAIYRVKQTRGYRVPTTLENWEQLARVLVVASCRIAKALYATGTPTIGGRPTTEIVKWL
jgi:hypothetical protein